MLYLTTILLLLLPSCIEGSLQCRFCSGYCSDTDTVIKCPESDKACVISFVNDAEVTDVNNTILGGLQVSLKTCLSFLNTTETIATNETKYNDIFCQCSKVNVNIQTFFSIKI